MRLEKLRILNAAGVRYAYGLAIGRHDEPGIALRNGFYRAPAAAYLLKAYYLTFPVALEQD